MKILMTPDAKRDFVRIQEYMEEDLKSAGSSEKFAKKAAGLIRQLAAFPNLGTALSNKIGYPSEYRYLMCDNYAIIYRAEEEKIIVVNILYAKRDFPRIFFGD